MSLIDWLLENEPWTRYRALRDLLDLPENNSQVQAARTAMLDHPQVQAMVQTAGGWSNRPIKRHNDASHPIYAISALADFGLQAGDPGMASVIESILAHQSPEGPFQSLVNIAPAYGGTGEDSWVWAACDAPTLLYILLQMGMGDHPGVQRAAAHLTSMPAENGYRCAAAASLGKFRGPGRKDDPCPIANVYALKALSLLQDAAATPAVQRAAEMLLRHWQRQKETKYYLFGVGSDFRKLKYPFVWYDILHVVEVLSRFPYIHTDPRFQEMLAAITAQPDPQGRYTAGSMYQSWKGWSFADKKNPSPWLTLLVRRIQKRVG